MKVTITLNGGKEITIDVPNYNPAELTEKLNNHQITMINIGDVVLGKHSIMIIEPYKAPVEETQVA